MERTGEPSDLLQTLDRWKAGSGISLVWYDCPPHASGKNGFRAAGGHLQQKAGRRVEPWQSSVEDQ